ncbi:hypothetical protein BB560_001941 [Smittium megazygosporum]|uniref:Uncharacterized protein n=1 Tax=Smittium megazygosporum TaxID=133381 RepID=A0A2T9ZG35_9FUNG|nr:hypothetical protein BB560_001941 [Smittium megazygosporum]
MCIVFWKLQQTPNEKCRYKFIYAGNRDEFFERPTQLTKERNIGEHVVLSPMDTEPPEHMRGTWLGISKSGRISFVTNFYEAVFKTEDKKSRGLLVQDFILNSSNSFQPRIQKVEQFYPEKSSEAGDQDNQGASEKPLAQNDTENSAETKDSLDKPDTKGSAKHGSNSDNLPPLVKTEYSLEKGENGFVEIIEGELTDAATVQSKLEQYDGFNLIQIDLKSMSASYITNRGSETGIFNLSGSDLHGLSNSCLNEWPKVEKGKQLIQDILDNCNLSRDEMVQKLFSVLENSEYSVENPPKLEEMRQTIFVPMHHLSSVKKQASGYYGTRSSCVILVDEDNIAYFYEKIHTPEHQNIDEKVENEDKQYLAEVREFVFSLNI